MKLEELKISLKNSWSDAGPDNPYQATLSVGYNDTKMQVQLNDETCRKILALAGDEIAAAAQVQIQDFVRTAISVSETTLIEAGKE